MNTMSSIEISRNNVQAVADRCDFFKDTKAQFVTGGHKARIINAVLNGTVWEEVEVFGGFDKKPKDIAGNLPKGFTRVKVHPTRAAKLQADFGYKGEVLEFVGFKGDHLVRIISSEICVEAYQSKRQYLAACGF